MQRHSAARERVLFLPRIVLIEGFAHGTTEGFFSFNASQRNSVYKEPIISQRISRSSCYLTMEGAHYVFMQILKAVSGFFLLKDQSLFLLSDTATCTVISCCPHHGSVSQGIFDILLHS